MPFINLIEEQRLIRRQENAKARTGLLSFACASALAIVSCGWLFLESEGADAEIYRLQNEAKKNEPVQKQIELARSSVQSMAPKLKTLESATELTGKWDTILNHLTVQTPKDTWLTSLRCVAGDPSKPIEVSFQGIAPRLDSIGEFILRLQSCEQLTNVGLKFTQEKLLASGTGIEFDISSAVAGTAEVVHTAKEETEETEEKKP